MWALSSQFGQGLGDSSLASHSLEMLNSGKCFHASLKDSWGVALPYLTTTMQIADCRMVVVVAAAGDANFSPAAETSAAAIHVPPRYNYPTTRSDEHELCC